MTEPFSILDYKNKDELFEALLDCLPSSLDTVARQNGFTPVSYLGKYGRNRLARELADHIWKSAMTIRKRA